VSSSSRLGGVVRATLVVGLLGAIGGALGGALIATVLVVARLVPGFNGIGDAIESIASASAFIGMFGAAYGVVLGPLLGWTLMRRVPLGRAIGETAFAAALGVGAAMVLPTWGFSILVYPLVAAVAAAVRLRYTHRLAPERTGSSPGQLKPG